MSALVDAERADDARATVHARAMAELGVLRTVIECDRDGISLQDQAARLGVSPWQVTWYRIRAGVERRRATRSGLLRQLEGCLRRDDAARAALKSLRRLLRESYE